MTQASSSRPARAGTRLEFVDACRALAVLGMLFANMMNVFLRRVPVVLRHNEGNQLRAFDFPAPVFQFLLGVSLVLFLERRGNDRGSARRQAFRRFTLLMALGLVLDGVGVLRVYPPQWGVLQTLGLGGLTAALLSGLPDAVVVGCALSFLGVYSGAANGDVHHNLIAAPAFVPLTLAGMLVGRGLGQGGARPSFVRRSVAVAAGGLAIAATTYAAGVPFNKVLGTSSFVALAITVSALLLLAFATLEGLAGRYPAWFLAIGSNALMAWVLQYVLVYYPAWLAFPAWRRLHLLPGMAASVGALATLAALTVILARRNIRIPI